MPDRPLGAETGFPRCVVAAPEACSCDRVLEERKARRDKLTERGQEDDGATGEKCADPCCVRR